MARFIQSDGASKGHPRTQLGTYGEKADGGVGSPVLNEAMAVRMGVKATTTSAAPVFTSQPSGVSKVVGQTATFAVVATGVPTPTYQWKKNGTNISGATSASYTTPALVAGDNGAVFTCVATNAAGSTTSGTATASVSLPAAPAFTVQPVGGLVALDSKPTMSATVTGATSYQWRKNGVDISGATSNSYTLTTLITEAVTSDIYTLAATGAGGTTISNNVVYSVTAPAVQSAPDMSSMLQYPCPPVQLPSGDIVLAGGFFAGGASPNTYQLSASAKTWAVRAAQPTTRVGAPAVLSETGKVIQVGGLLATTYAYNSYTYEFDDAANSWVQRPVLPNGGPFYHCVVKLANGDLISFGGQNGNTNAFLSDTYRYNSTTHTWSAVGNLPDARSGMQAILLSTGKVLCYGGHTSVGLASSWHCYLFDPSTNTWGNGGNFPGTNDYPSNAVLLADNTVLVVGGDLSGSNGSRGSYICAADGSGWGQAGGPQPYLTGVNKKMVALVKLSSGKVMAIGGYDNTYTNTATCCISPGTNGSSMSWTATAPLPQGRRMANAFALPSDKVVVVGGSTILNGSEYYYPRACPLYDAALNTWT